MRTLQRQHFLMLQGFVDAVPALEELTEPTRGLPAECWLPC
ncbi:hypothetical protein ECP03052937_1780 [Escherichia coli p0305293.7]|nr:hypothetical protein ECP03052937_1780 [Escherichia coli p0305293.7]